MDLISARAYMAYYAIYAMQAERCVRPPEFTSSLSLALA